MVKTFLYQDLQKLNKNIIKLQNLVNFTTKFYPKVFLQ